MAGVGGGRDRERGRGHGHGQFSGIWGACAGLIAYYYRPPPGPSFDVTASGREQSHQPKARVKSRSGATWLPCTLVPYSPSPSSRRPETVKGTEGIWGPEAAPEKKEGSGPVVQLSGKPVEAAKGALLFALWCRSPLFRPLSMVKAILQGQMKESCIHLVSGRHRKGGWVLFLPSFGGVKNRMRDVDKSRWRSCPRRSCGHLGGNTERRRLYCRCQGWSDCPPRHHPAHLFPATTLIRTTFLSAPSEQCWS